MKMENENEGPKELNGAVLAARIIALEDKKIAQSLEKFVEKMAQQVADKNKALVMPAGAFFIFVICGTNPIKTLTRPAEWPKTGSHVRGYKGYYVHYVSFKLSI